MTGGHQFTDGYRLPTEAEWERAAAWNGAFHWVYGFQSNAITTVSSHYTDTNPYGLTAFPYTSPVGFFDGANTFVFHISGDNTGKGTAKIGRERVNFLIFV